MTVRIYATLMSREMRGPVIGGNRCCCTNWRGRRISPDPRGKMSLLGSLMTRAPSPNGSVHITVKPVDRMRPSGSRRIGGIPLPREHVVAIVLCAVSTFDPLCRGLRPLSMGNDAIHAGRVQRANHQRYPKHGRVLFFEPCCTGLAIG